MPGGARARARPGAMEIESDAKNAKHVGGETAPTTADRVTADTRVRAHRL